MNQTCRPSSVRVHLSGGSLLILYGFFLFWPIPFANVTLASGDILDQFYPWTEFWVKELRTGEFPLWNPYTYGGSPLLGNLQIAPFYPPQFLLSWMSPLRSFGWTLLLHTVFAGIAMYLLIFHLTKSRVAATAMGLVYMSSGFLILRPYAGHLTIANSLPWVPLIVLSYLRWSDRPSWGRWSLLAAVLAVQLLAGQPQIPYLTGLLIGFLSLRDSWTLYRRGNRSMDVILRPAGAVLLAGMVALLLTAMLWLPFYSYYRLSAPRSEGLTYVSATQNSLPPVHLASFLLPFLFGDPTGEGFWGQVMIGYHEICGFLGLGTLLLAIAALWTPPFPRKRWWIACTILSALLALGANTPLYRLAYWFIPGMQSFRIPARFLLPYTIGVCVLGGHGLAAWLDTRERLLLRRRGTVLVAALLSLAILAALGASLLLPECCHGFLADFPIPAAKPTLGGQPANVGEILLNRYHDVLKALAIGLGFASLWFGWMLLAGPCSGRRKSYAAAAIVLMAIELGWFAPRFIQPQQADAILATHYPKTETVRFLQENSKLSRTLLPDITIGRLYRKRHPELFPNRTMHYGLQTVRGYDVTLLKDYARYVHEMQHRPDAVFSEVLLDISPPGQMNRALLSALNVRYVALPERVELKDFDLAFDGNPPVYAYRKAFPRAYVLPLDQSISAVLPKDATVEIERYTPNEIQLRAELERPGWLVVADNYYPEWKARVNGRPVPVTKVLTTFRGIQLAPGQYSVRMYYDPSSLKHGALLSLLTLLGLLAVNTAAARRRGKQASPK